MTLIEIVDKLLEIAQKMPNIGYAGEGDIYELNNIPNIDYSVFFITQDTHRVYENKVEYTLNLFFVDRIIEAIPNRIFVQTNGISAITNIVNKLVAEEDVDVLYPLNFTPFNQRFADDCSGVWARITFVVDNSLGICVYQ